MKRKPKWMISLLMILAMVLGACGGSGGGESTTRNVNPAAGNWIGQYLKMVGDSYADRDQTSAFHLELKEDGTGTHYRDDLELEVKWTLDGEAFTMTETFMGMTIDYTGTLTGDDLDLFNADPDDIWTTEYVYVREGGTSNRKEPTDEVPATTENTTDETSSETAVGESSASSEIASGDTASDETETTPEDASSAEAASSTGDPAADSAALSGEEGYYVLEEYTVGDQTVTREMYEAAELGEAFLELKEGGEADINIFGQEMDITWEPGTIIAYGVMEYSYTLEGDKLILDMADVLYTFQKSDGTEAASDASSAAGVQTEEPAEGSSEEPTDTSSAVPAGVPSGDGLVSEEELLKGYVWMDKVAKDIFNTTYEGLAEHFGVDGEFDKEEYSEHMGRNKRYYKWISTEDPHHFIYVNFDEKDAENAPGVYTISGFNSSGFLGSDAAEQYLEAVQAEEREKNIAGAANMPMKEFSTDIHPFANDEVTLTIGAEIPESGWSYAERTGKLIDNEDPDAFGAGFIQFTLKSKVEDFDFYKDQFENYQEIADRDFDGITFKGRTYKNIGYEWTEYIAQIDDERALAIGIVRVDLAEGTVGDRILDSITIK